MNPKIRPSRAKRAAAAHIGVETQRKQDRLAQVRPDLLAEIRAGRKTTHAAYIEAGFGKREALRD
jgi:hypothetical protein